MVQKSGLVLDELLFQSSLATYFAQSHNNQDGAIALATVDEQAHDNVNEGQMKRTLDLSARPSFSRYQRINGCSIPTRLLRG